eukprot:gene7444-584_t
MTSTTIKVTSTSNSTASKASTIEPEIDLDSGLRREADIILTCSDTSSGSGCLIDDSEQANIGEASALSSRACSQHERESALTCADSIVAQVAELNSAGIQVADLKSPETFQPI